jgi:cellulose synthase/poly-beta-1,6-N-acetylglucosamine synthase-like glycosyltransferase
MSGGDVHAHVPFQSWPHRHAGTDSSLARSLAVGDPLPRSDPVDAELLWQLGISPAWIEQHHTTWPAGMTAARAAILSGELSPELHARAIAQRLGCPYADTELELLGPGTDLIRYGRLTDGRACAVIVADAAPLGWLQQASPQATHGLVIVVTGRTADRAAQAARRHAALKHAISDLARRQPELSATRPLVPWQTLSIAGAFGLVLGGIAVAPAATLAALLAVLTLPFAAVVWVRLAAVREAWRTTAAPPPHRTDAELPTYTVLVALYDEAAVLPELIAALARLDYPPAKLDLVLVLEAADRATIQALARLRIPANLRTVLVPDRAPRTKPKALNYALQFATGDYVVVFDAEDRPDPDQLRKAAAMFAAEAPDLACVQARLNLYNPRDGWLSRHFTIEYSALFDAILPALERMRLPVPLGGTSNHFPRALLQSIGAWDPFNVTEDADLGIRLARLGLRTRMLAATTWEEAPVTWRQWLPQRTRWLKGWYQTYAVHTRDLNRLARDLGFWRTVGFHAFLGGSILSTLIHPIFYLLLITAWWTEATLTLPGVVGWLGIAIGAVVLVSGYVSAMLVGWLAIRRRHRGLSRSVVTTPILWLLVSIAGYRALWQLWRAPFLWEKTAHGRTRSGRLPQFRRRRAADRDQQ